jgi:hypothetical protein
MPLSDDRLVYVLRYDGTRLEIEDQLRDGFIDSLPPGSDEPTTVQSYIIPPGSDEQSGMASLVAQGKLEMSPTLGMDDSALRAAIADRLVEHSEVPVAFVVESSSVETAVGRVGELVGRINRDVRVIRVERG